jgi:competence transcription factor ComK
MKATCLNVQPFREGIWLKMILIREFQALREKHPNNADEKVTFIFNELFEVLFDENNF